MAGFQVSQAAEYSPSSLQVTNLNVDMTKQMEFMENDGSTKIETDEGKTETGLQHVVDDLKDVSIQSGSKFYASTEEEEREGEGEGNQIVKRPEKKKKKKTKSQETTGLSQMSPKKPRRKTEDGFSVYTEEDLGWNKKNAGGTNLCPFDCDCCF